MARLNTVFRLTAVTPFASKGHQEDFQDIIDLVANCNNWSS